MLLYHIGLIADHENYLVYLIRKSVNDVFKNRPAGHNDKRFWPLKCEWPHASPFSCCENDCLHVNVIYLLQLASYYYQFHFSKSRTSSIRIWDTNSGTCETII